MPNRPVRPARAGHLERHHLKADHRRRENDHEKYREGQPQPVHPLPRHETNHRRADQPPHVDDRIDQIAARRIRVALD
ncbi:MAG: hypothetical protein C4321_06130 [Chloroflexota bacterium]